MRARRSFDIDRWLRRHNAGEPFPRLRAEPTGHLTGRERLTALREERRADLAARRAADAARERAHAAGDRAERLRWEHARERLWEDEHGAIATSGL